MPEDYEKRRREDEKRMEAFLDKRKKAYEEQKNATKTVEKPVKTEEPVKAAEKVNLPPKKLTENVKNSIFAPTVAPKPLPNATPEFSKSFNLYRDKVKEVKSEIRKENVDPLQSSNPVKLLEEREGIIKQNVEGNAIIDTPHFKENYLKKYEAIEDELMQILETTNELHKELEANPTQDKIKKYDELVERIQYLNREYDALNKESQAFLKAAEKYTTNNYANFVNSKVKEIEKSQKDLGYNYYLEIGKKLTGDVLMSMTTSPRKNIPTEAEVKGRKLEAAKFIYQDAQKLINAPKNKQGLLKGTFNFTEEAGGALISEKFWRNIGTLGTAKIEDDLIVLSSVTKAAQNKPLTKEDEILLDALLTKTLVASQREGNISIGYQGAEMFTESIPFMLSFLATSGVSSGVVKGAEKLTQQAMYNYGKKKLYKNLGKEATEELIKKEEAKLLLRQATSKLTKYVPKAAGVAADMTAGAVMRTPLMPTSYSQFIEDITPTVVSKDAGRYETQKGMSVMQAIGDVVWETASESSGAMFTGVAGMLGKFVKRTPLKNFINSAAGNRLGIALFNSEGIINRAGFNGLFSETAEEYFGNAGRYVTGVIDKQEYRDFYEWNNQAAMIVSFAAMTGIGLAPNEARRLKAYKDYKNNINNLKHNGFEESDIVKLNDILNNTNYKDIPVALGNFAAQSGIIQSEGDNLTEEEQKALNNLLTYSISYIQKKNLNNSIQAENPEIPFGAKVEGTTVSVVNGQGQVLHSNTYKTEQEAQTIAKELNNKIQDIHEEQEAKTDITDSIIAENDPVRSDDGNLYEFVVTEEKPLPTNKYKTKLLNENLVSIHLISSPESLTDGTEVVVVREKYIIDGEIQIADNTVSVEVAKEIFNNSEAFTPEQERKIADEVSTKAITNAKIQEVEQMNQGIFVNTKEGKILLPVGSYQILEANNDEIILRVENGTEEGMTIPTSLKEQIVENEEQVGQNKVGSQENETTDNQNQKVESIEENKENTELPEDLNNLTPEQELVYAERELGVEQTMQEASATIKAISKQIEAAEKKKDKKTTIKDRVAVQKEINELKAKSKIYSSYILKNTKAPEVKSKEVKKEAPKVNILDKWNKAKKIKGNKTAVTLVNGKRIKGNYYLVEAEAPTASHNPNKNFQKSEDFPVDENGKTINDRDYEHDKAAQYQVIDKGNRYDSRALENIVIVSPEGLVLSGNDRTMSGQLAAVQGTDKEYLDFLNEYSENYGFTQEQISEYKHPRVVFVVSESIPLTTEYFAMFNTDDRKSQNKTEKAVKVGKTISEETVLRIARIFNRYDKLTEVYNSPAATSDILDVLLNDKIIQPNEVSVLLSHDGTLFSGQGRDMVESLIIGSVLTEDAVRIVNSKNSLKQAILTAIVPLLQNAKMGEMYSLKEEIDLAIKLSYESSKVEMTIQQYMSQTVIEGFIEDPNDIYSITVVRVAEQLSSEKYADFRKFILSYNEIADAYSQGQVDMFTNRVLTKEEIIEQLLNLNSHEQKQNSTEQVRTDDTSKGKSKNRRGEKQEASVDRSTQERGDDRGTDTESSKQPVETPTSKESLQANLDEQIEEQNVNTSPTEAQKKAGNYKKGHVTVQGMDISVENPKGSVRSGIDEDGKAWEHVMQSHYGYFLKTEGKDGDHIDVFIGEAPESDKIYVIDQINPKTKAFDESKVMVGYNSPEEAKEAYMENYDNDWKGFSAITEVSIEDYKKWAYDGKRQRKPFNEYKETTQPVEKVKEAWEMTNEELESEINVYENTIKERESYILKSNTPLTGSNSGIGTLTESELNRFTSLTNEQQRRNTISSEEARKRRDESRAKRLAERNDQTTPQQKQQQSKPKPSAIEQIGEELKKEKEGLEQLKTKEQQIQDAINERNDGKDVEVTGDIIERLKKMFKGSQMILDMIDAIIKNGDKIRGIFAKGKIIISSNQSIEEAVSSFEHERQHIENKTDKEFKKIQQDIIDNVDINVLKREVRLLSGATTYDRFSKQVLADEYIAFVVQNYHDKKEIKSSLKYQKIIENEYTTKNRDRLSNTTWNLHGNRNADNSNRGIDEDSGGTRYNILGSLFGEIGQNKEIIENEYTTKNRDRLRRTVRDTNANRIEGIDTARVLQDNGRKESSVRRSPSDTFRQNIGIDENENIKEKNVNNYLKHLLFRLSGILPQFKNTSIVDIDDVLFNITADSPFLDLNAKMKIYKKAFGETAAKIIRNKMSVAFDQQDELITYLSKRIPIKSHMSYILENMAGDIEHDFLTRNEQKEQKESAGNLHSILSSVGYNVNIINNKSEANQFISYYQGEGSDNRNGGSIICTYNDVEGRLRGNYITFIVKSDAATTMRAEQLTQENLNDTWKEYLEANGRKNEDGTYNLSGLKNHREDPFSTSVLSIQIDKSNGYLRVISRYNHTIHDGNVNPDAVFNKQLNKIAKGFEESLYEYFNAPKRKEDKIVSLPEGVFKDNDNRLFKYSEEFNGVTYGEGFYFKNGVTTLLDPNTERMAMGVVYSQNGETLDVIGDGFIFTKPNKITFVDKNKIKINTDKLGVVEFETEDGQIKQGVKVDDITPLIERMNDYFIKYEYLDNGNIEIRNVISEHKRYIHVFWNDRIQSIGEYADFGYSKLESLGNLQSIGGNADFSYSKLESLGNLKSIGGDAYFGNSKLESLGNLQSIGGNANFWGSQITSLGNLQSIGGNANFRESQITSLENLQSIGGNANFSYSKLESLGNLKSIGEYADFSYSKLESLGNLKSIGGDAYFGNSKLESLGNLQSIGGNANFWGLQITSLGNLQSIGGNANFEESQITSLGNLQSIGGNADFSYSKLESLGNLKSIGEYADFGNSKLESLGNLKSIGGDAYFIESQNNHELLSTIKTNDPKAKELSEKIHQEVLDNLEDIRFNLSPTSEIGFYSTVENALLKIKQDKGTKEQFKVMLLNNGAKQAELDWMDYDGTFTGKSITKAEIQQWIDENKIQVEEKVKGDGFIVRDIENEKDVKEFADYEQAVDFVNSEKKKGNSYSVLPKSDKTTKYEEYQLPGGENYKELLLTMPVAQIKEKQFDFYNGVYRLKDGRSIDLTSATNPIKTKDELLSNLKVFGISESDLENKIPDKPNDSKYKVINEFKSSHFDEPNILAHVRFNERTVNGERVLFLEEIQSDWAQKGKKEGFKSKDFKWDSELGKKAVKAIKNENNLGFDSWQEAAREIEKNADFFNTFDISYENMKILVEWRDAVVQERKVPDMPFKKTDQWVNLAARRMMRYAAENGFDRIAWTNGEQQFDRWGSEKIDWQKESSSKYPERERWKITVEEQFRGTVFEGMDINNKALSERNIYVSTKDQLKEVVQRNLSRERNAAEVEKLTDRIWERMQKEDSGTSLPRKEGMESFYDGIVPSAMNKLGKPFGAKVENVSIKQKDNGFTLTLKDNNGNVTTNQFDSKAKAYSWLTNAVNNGSKYEVISEEDGATLSLQQSIPITEKMKESVMEGMPLFNLSAEENDIRFLILGEKGAAALDKLEEATTRMDNLQVAKEMEGTNPLDTLLNDYLTKGSSLDNEKLMDYYGLKRFTLQNKYGFAVLSLVQAKEYGKGSGTKIMRDLSLWADKNKISIALTPDTSFGATSVSRLKEFYKRFGFKDNSGKSKDFSTRESMIRTPKELKQFTPKEIRLATGWEKGVDGLWRYEVADGKVNDNHYSDLIERKFNEDIKSGLINATTLGELYDSKELYSAYPEFENIQVILYEDENQSARASYNPAEKAIYIYNPLSLKSIEGRNKSLIHEIQHAIQKIEGFAKGGNQNMFTTEQLFQKAKELGLLGKDLTDNEIKFKAYQALAGEVEARNAEFRSDMDNIEKLNTLLSETEDISREDQIFLEESVDDIRFNIGSSSVADLQKERVEAFIKMDSAKNYAEMKVFIDEVKRLGGEIKDLKETPYSQDDLEKIKNFVESHNLTVDEAINAIEYSLSPTVAILGSKMRVAVTKKYRELKANAKHQDLKSAIKDAVAFAKTISEDTTWGEWKLMDEKKRIVIKQILTQLNRAATKKDINRELDKMFDILIERQNYVANDVLNKLFEIKISDTSGKGIRVGKNVDDETRVAITAIKENKAQSPEQLSEKIADLTDLLNETTDEIKRGELNAKIYGLEIALMYQERVSRTQEQIAEIQDDLEKETDKSKKQALNGLLREERSTLQNHLEFFINEIHGVISKGIESRKSFVNNQSEHKKEILHDAARDLKQVKMFINKETNKSGIRKAILAISSPMRTFTTMLKEMGKYYPEGKGNLYTRFVEKGIIRSLTNEYLGLKEVQDKLSKDIKTIFGDKHSLEKLRVFAKKDNGNKIEITKNEKKQTIDLTNGQVMYIYMVNKMHDGKMKLNEMGISESDVDRLKTSLPDDIIAFCDYVQEDLLPSLRTKYNKTHVELFGIQMDEIENYFPLKIAKEAIREDVDVDEPTKSLMPTTTTGAIIRRKRNKNTIDVANADAIEILQDHIKEMEYWNSHASMIQDLNTLNSSLFFKNKLNSLSEGMAKRFFELSQIALRKYDSKRSEVDEFAMKASKFIAVSKIAIRLNTAIKQLLSMVAFFVNADPSFYKYGIKNMVNFTESNIRWGMKNLPLFEERWKSRSGGDDRLSLSKENLSAMGNIFNKVSKIGLVPNAAVDLLACAWGAKTMYDTKYAQYIEMGLEPEVARSKALVDAEMIYNETQQSQEALFLSKVQSDRTFLGAAFSLFNNASFAYGRQLIEGLRGIKAFSTNKKLMIDNQAKKYIKEGLTPENALKFAKIDVNRSVKRDVLRIGMFGYLVQVVWNFGSDNSIPQSISNLWTMLFGDDDDKEKLKEEKSLELKKAMLLGLVMPVRGLIGGKELESLIGMTAEGYQPQFISGAMRSTPLGADLMGAYEDLMEGFNKGDWKLLANTLLTLGTSFTGTNINSIYNCVFSIYDFVSTSDKTVHDVAYDLSLLINAPKSDQKKLALAKRDGETLEGYIERYIELKRLHKYGVFSPLADKNPTKKEITDVVKVINVSYQDLKETVNEIKKANKKANEGRPEDEDEIETYSTKSRAYRDAERILYRYEEDFKTRELTKREVSIIKKVTENLRKEIE